MSNILALIIGCAGTVFLTWVLSDGFSSGVMRFDYYSLHFHGHRRDQPIRFWAAAVLVSLTLFMVVIGTIVMILD